jgi:hypothetical protein
MVTAVYAARNIIGESYDIWDVNVEEDYHEQDSSSSSSPSTSGDRLVPGRIQRPSIADALEEVFAKFDPVALGASVGLVSGALVFIATAALLLVGGEPLGPNLSLLGNYLLGYEVTWTGAFLGLIEASVAGFAFGYLLARMINAVVSREQRQLLDRVEGGRIMNLFEGDEL